MRVAQITKEERVGAISVDIKEYSDGRFGFDYTPPGGKRLQIRLKNLDAAVRKARQLAGAAEAGKVQLLGIDPDEYAEFLRWKAARKQPALIPELIGGFLDAKRGRGVTMATVRELRSTLDAFAKSFTGPIAAIQKKNVEDWLAGYRVGARRFNNMRAAIFALFRFARREGFLVAELTPVERIEKRKIIPAIETYSPEEMESLLQAFDVKWLPLLVLGGFCGLRPEEIAPDPRKGNDKPGLAWENVLWEKKKIDVPAKVSKVRRRRFAILTEAAAAFLAPWRHASGPVVPRRDAQRVIRDAMGAAGEWKRNALRHSYASYRLALTKDAPALALEMGNSPAMIFNHYLDLKHDDEAERWFAIRPK